MKNPIIARNASDFMPRDAPSLANAWTMPIKNRTDMLSTGIKTPIGIKVSGADLKILQSLALQIAEEMKTLPDTLSAYGDRAVKTSDIGGYVALAKKTLAEHVTIPAGYTVSWSGQFEYMERAAERLRIVVPLTLSLIFILLYCAFRNITEPAIVMLTIPFSLIGGIWFIYLLDYNLSIAVYVGFIALAGTAAETGVMVLSFIDIEIEKLRELKQEPLTAADIKTAAENATALRVRPVAITALANIVGLCPIMWATGAGADVTQRIAAPALGGMLTVLILSLLVFPVIYSLALQFQEKGRQ